MHLPLARAALTMVVVLFTAPPAIGASWIVPDWIGKEPSFPAGSLYFRTGEYRKCPIIYRLAIDTGGAAAIAAIEGRAAGEFAYLFVNGRAAGRFEGGGPDGTVAFAADLTPYLEPGLNVLVVSAGGDGLTFQGLVDGAGRPAAMFSSDPAAVKVTKLPPLLLLADEPALRPGFDDSGWFAVRLGERPGISLSEDALRARARELAAGRLSRLDEEARWRLQMLAAKGIAIADGEAAGFGGAARLPVWIRQAARPEGEGPPGSIFHRAEALARLVGARDEAGNLERQASALAALDAPAAEVEAVRAAAREVRQAAAGAEESARAGRFEESASRSREGQAAAAALRRSMVLNRPNRCLENKFGWFDTTAMLDSDPARWGLRLGGDLEVVLSPLSPATLITLHGGELAIDGWDTVPPIKVYQKPPVTGPVCLWAVLDGREAALRPGADGIVYDREKHGKPSENWMALVPDLSRGGDLPIELVFLDPPERISFRAGEKGTDGVRISFPAPGARLLILRPLKEWRGLLEEARVLAGEKLDPSRARRYLDQFRLWSRAALALPVEFSEAFVREPGESPTLRVADVYEYRELSDFLGTRPLRLALLPPLASYGLLVGYPGLEVRGPAKALGSLGMWGDLVAAEGEDRVVYRAPLDAVPRYGGFTAYCFGPTDIGEPGGRREIETVKATGSNSFRPQHNQTGERAIQTVRWCVEQGLQNVFNIDEKWVLDAVEHYRTLARAVKDFPPGAVAYDLLNEPETRQPRAYGALTRKITRAIREIDRTHLIYLEAMPEWGPGAKPFPRGAFETLEATGDPLTVYSFHDYGQRLSARWPSETADVRDLLERWIPAFRFSIDHRAPIHLGEWGGFEQTKESVWDNPCALTMTLDFLDVFEAFGWHFHYYSNRGTTRVRKDGSLEESRVQEAFRRHFARGTFNATRRPPPGPEKHGERRG